MVARDGIAQHYTIPPIPLTGIYLDPRLEITRHHVFNNLQATRIFPPKPGAKSGRQRVDRSFKSALKTAGIENFRFHNLRHTFASWYMMNGGDLYELAKILGHANIKMTERYAKLAKQHIARTGNTAREMWRMMEKSKGEGSERVG